MAVASDPIDWQHDKEHTLGARGGLNKSKSWQEHCWLQQAILEASLYLIAQSTECRLAEEPAMPKRHMCA